MNRFEQHVANLTLVRENDFPTPLLQPARRHPATSFAVRSRQRLGLGKTLCAMFLVCGVVVATAKTMTAASSAPGDNPGFSVLYAFQAVNPSTLASPFGSQPDTTPALGPGNTIYGMTVAGGVNGTGVVYRYDIQ
jgi:uncharacterized repeat protein (TIGR03803 family)